MDVERLATVAVGAARSAAQELALAQGRHVRVGTSASLVAGAFAALDHLRLDGRRPVPFAPLSGFFRVSDGWVRTHANYPHHAAALTRTVGATDRESFVRALESWSAVDLEEAVTVGNGVAVAVRTPGEWDAHPQGRATSGEPWVEPECLGERPVVPGDGGLLGGVRVLDLTRVIAGPTCGQLVACLGADVLRVDPVARPELLDQYLSNGMGKRAAAADLSAVPADLERLLAAADVVLLGYRPGALDRFGLDPRELLDRHPHLVVGTLAAWGFRGPWARRRGFDSLVQAATGIAVLCAAGDEEAAPGALPVQALDHATGYAMAAGVVRMLARRRAGLVRASLVGAARRLRDYPVPDAAPTRLPEPVRVRMSSPHGTLEAVPPPLTLDGHTVEQPVGAYGQAQLCWR